MGQCVVEVRSLRAAVRLHRSGREIVCVYQCPFNSPTPRSGPSAFLPISAIAIAQFPSFGRQSELPETGHCRHERRDIASRHVDTASLEHRGPGGRHLLRSEGRHRPPRAEVWVGHHWPAELSGVLGNADPDARREGRPACGRIIAASVKLWSFVGRRRGAETGRFQLL